MFEMIALSACYSPSSARKVDREPQLALRHRRQMKAAADRRRRGAQTEHGYTGRIAFTGTNKLFR